MCATAHARNKIIDRPTPPSPYIVGLRGYLRSVGYAGTSDRSWRCAGGEQVKSRGVCVFEKRLRGRASGGRVGFTLLAGRPRIVGLGALATAVLARRHIVHVLIRTVAHTVMPRRNCFIDRHASFALPAPLVTRQTRPGSPGPQLFYCTRP